MRHICDIITLANLNRWKVHPQAEGVLRVSYGLSGGHWLSGVIRPKVSLRMPSRSPRPRAALRSSKRKLFSDYRGDTDLIIRDLSKTDRQDNTRTVAVIKSHSPGIKTRNWAGQGKIKNICTIRDPRDCFASYERFWPKENGESIESRIEDFRSWLELADGFSNDGYSLLIRYEDMIANSLEQIRRISDYLGIRCSEDLLKEIATSTGVEAGQAIIDRMVAGKSGNERVFNPVTQLHENHLNGGEIGRWRNDLPAEIQEKVHTAFLPWLIKFGYVDGDESGNNPSSFDAKFAKKSPQSVKRDHRPGRLPVSCQCCRSITIAAIRAGFYSLPSSTIGRPSD